jgi:hypothetical protein
MTKENTESGGSVKRLGTRIGKWNDARWNDVLASPSQSMATRGWMVVDRIADMLGYERYPQSGRIE